MGILSYFSKAEREKRRVKREREETQKQREAVDELLGELRNPNEIVLGEFIFKAMALEDLCGWPPPREHYWAYVRALGCQSVACVWLAENVHHCQFYPSLSFAPQTNMVPTWRRAAQKARQLAERAIFAAEKAKEKHGDVVANATASLSQFITRAEAAWAVSHEDARDLPSYTENRFEQSSGWGLPWGPLGQRFCLPPELIGAVTGTDGTRQIPMPETALPEMLASAELQWLRTDCSLGDEDLVEALPFEETHVVYAEDRPDMAPQLPSALGLRVGENTMDWDRVQFVASSSATDRIHLDGRLPITKEYQLLQHKKVGELLPLRIAQGPYDSPGYELALIGIVVAVEQRGKDSLHLDLGISERGELRLSARDDQGEPVPAVRLI